MVYSLSAKGIGQNNKSKKAISVHKIILLNNLKVYKPTVGPGQNRTLLRAVAGEATLQPPRPPWLPTMQEARSGLRGVSISGTHGSAGMKPGHSGHLLRLPGQTWVRGQTGGPGGRGSTARFWALPGAAVRSGHSTLARSRIYNLKITLTIYRGYRKMYTHSEKGKTVKIVILDISC